MRLLRHDQTLTVQKSNKSFKRNKGPNFIFLFNYGWSLVSKTDIFKIAAEAVFEKSAHSANF
jgi:hypothetical protein